STRTTVRVVAGQLAAELVLRLIHVLPVGCVLCSVSRFRPIVVSGILASGCSNVVAPPGVIGCFRLARQFAERFWLSRPDEHTCWQRPDRGPRGPRLDSPGRQAWVSKQRATIQ